MKFDGEKSEAVFESTGARGYASCRVISIDDDLELATGYDLSFSIDVETFGDPLNGDSRHLTREERIELADHYIALWTRFRDEQ
jgi:hypothetical protein